MFFNEKNNDHSPQVVLKVLFIVPNNEPHILQETLGVFLQLSF